MTDENNQKKLQALMYQIKSYQATLEDIARQAALTERALGEISAAIEAVGNMPKAKEAEALIPLGAGVFTKAKLTGKDELIVSAGSGMFLSKTAAEAKTYLESKKKMIETNSGKLNEEAQKISCELDKANAAAEELYAKLQGQ